MWTLYWQMPAMLARQLGTPFTTFEVAILAPKGHIRSPRASRKDFQTWSSAALRGAKTTHLRTFSASSRVMMHRPAAAHLTGGHTATTRTKSTATRAVRPVPLAGHASLARYRRLPRPSRTQACVGA